MLPYLYSSRYYSSDIKQSHIKRWSIRQITALSRQRLKLYHARRHLSIVFRQRNQFLPQMLRFPLNISLLLRFSQCQFYFSLTSADDKLRAADKTDGAAVKHAPSKYLYSLQISKQITMRRSHYIPICKNYLTSTLSWPSCTDTKTSEGTDSLSYISRTIWSSIRFCTIRRTFRAPYSAL